MSTEGFDHLEGTHSVARRWTYEAVAAVLSDDHNFERGVEATSAVANAVLADAGAGGLVELVVELSLRLADALERIAAEEQIAAADLAQVWFVD